MLITDSVIRLLKGSLKAGVTDIESFSSSLTEDATLLEYPQYTKPRIYKRHSVPPVLLSGNHKKIEEWKQKASLKETKKYRLDLL